MKPQPFIFVQLNEVNFDVVRAYLARYELPAFRRLLESFHAFDTFAEEDYAELEPWIQWVSAQTGKTFAEHGVFRLGDMVNSPDHLVQIFEALEAKGLKVGAVSPMNARNRLKKPAYFIPDPWTETPCDGSPFSKRLTAMLRQTVNDNASARISRRSYAAIAEATFRSLHWRRTPALVRTIWATRKRPWLKSLVLDQLVHLVHLRLWKGQRPDASFVFLNAGAHIQHHYFLNAEFAPSKARNPAWYVDEGVDPVRDMLTIYDSILQDYLDLVTQGARLLVATGLTQVPYDRVKYYYRLKNHAQFLAQAGIRFSRVMPRMTRDFEICFENETDGDAAFQCLSTMTLERTGLPLFSDIERRERGLFVTLTYPEEIRSDDVACRGPHRIPGFGGQVAFVAIKNGMHSTRGYAFMSPNTPARIPTAAVHVSQLFDLTLQATS